MAAILAISGVVSLAYPIAAGIVYFSNPIPSPEATVWLLRLTLLGLLLGSQLAPIILSASVLMMETLEDEARTVMLAQRLLGVTATAFLIALAIWAFQIVEEGGELGIGTVVARFTPLLALFLVLYFVVTSLVPYLIGYRQSARWRRSFLSDEEALRKRLLDALEVPSTDTKLHALQEVATATDEELARCQRDQIVTLAQQLDEATLAGTTVEDYPVALRPLVESEGDFRRIDPRFRHLTWLEEFRARVQEIAEEMERKRTKAAVVKLSQEWAAYYRDRKEAPPNGQAAERPTRSVGTVVVSFLVSSGLLGFALSEAAKFVSKSITAAGP
jgi:hypothetical protein